MVAPGSSDYTITEAISSVRKVSTNCHIALSILIKINSMIWKIQKLNYVIDKIVLIYRLLFVLMSQYIGVMKFQEFSSEARNSAHNPSGILSNP